MSDYDYEYGRHGHHHEDEKHHHHHHEEKNHHHHGEERRYGEEERYREEQRYGGYPGGNPGYYETPYGAAPPPAYGYSAPGYPQQPGFGGYAQPPYGAMQPSSYGAVQPAPYGAVPPVPYGAVQSSSYYDEERRQETADYAHAQEHKHKNSEHMGELGALASGAFAMYEAHEVKVDPEHAGRHRIEESMAAVTALGSGGYALYEHQQVRHDHKLGEGSYPGKHEKKEHHGFF